MNAIRRTALLLGLTASVIVGSSIPASATFADSVAAQVAVGTLAVAAPGGVTATVTRCHLVHDMEVTVSWNGSTTTRGVTGYRVTTHLSDGTSTVVATTGSAARSVATSFDRTAREMQPRVTVATLTSYGWTAESPRSAVISC